MAKDWDRYKAKIHSYYILQRKPLADVRRLMEQIYGFKASIRAYKLKVDEWGFKKYKKRESRQQTTQIRELDTFDQARSDAKATLHEHFPEAILQSVSVAQDSTNVRLSPTLELNGALTDFDVLQNRADNVALQSTRDVRTNPNTTNDEVSNLANGHRLDRLRQATVSGIIGYFKFVVSTEPAETIQSFVAEHPLHFVLSKRPLHRSIVAMLESILELGADIDLTDENGSSPLHIQCHGLRKGFRRYNWLDDELDVIELLLNKGANICLRNKQGRTFLQTFLDDIPSYICTRHKRLTTATFAAVGRFIKKEGDMNTFLKSGKELFEFYFSEQWSSQYCDNGSEISVLAMLCQNIDLSGPMTSGGSPVHYLLKSNYPGSEKAKLLEILLDRGVDPDQLVHRLLKSNHAGNDRAKLLEILLNRGADPDQLDTLGRSPLLVALRDYWTWKPAEVLLSGGASATLRSRHGELPIYVAARDAHPDRLVMVKLLADRMEIGDFERESTLYPDRLWWLKYFAFRERKTWCTKDVKDLCLPGDPEPSLALRKLLLSFLAKELLANSSHPSSMMSIICDCVELRLADGEQWYDLLRT